MSIIWITKISNNGRFFHSTQLDPDEDDEDFDAEAAELEASDDSEEESEDEDEEEVEEEDALHEVAVMPRGRATKSLTPVRSKKADPDGIGQIVAAAKKMTVEEKPYSFKTIDPLKIWSFTADNKKNVVVQFVSVPLPEAYFKAEVSSSGNELMYYRGTPWWFGGSKYLKREKVADNVRFHRDGTEEIACSDVTQEIRKNEELDANKTYWGEPQIVHLPFPCEQHVTVSFNLFRTGKMVASQNAAGDLVQHPQYVQLVKCALIGIEKRLKNQGRRREVVVDVGLDDLNDYSDDADSDDDNGDGDEMDDIWLFLWWVGIEILYRSR